VITVPQIRAGKQSAALVGLGLVQVVFWVPFIFDVVTLPSLDDMPGRWSWFPGHLNLDLGTLVDVVPAVGMVTAGSLRLAGGLRWRPTGSFMNYTIFGEVAAMMLLVATRVVGTAIGVLERPGSFSFGLALEYFLYLAPPLSGAIASVRRKHALTR
jgi:hypothetical protein